MCRSVALAILACLPLPAAAQDLPLVDHVANMLLALQPGSHSYMREGVVEIQQLEPGVFEQSAEGQRTIITTIAELEPCIFSYSATRGTRLMGSYHLDMRKLKGVSYTSRKPDENGIATIVVYTDAQPGYITKDDGSEVEAERFVPAIETDVPVASLEASVAALKEVCGTGDPTAAP